MLSLNRAARREGGCKIECVLARRARTAGGANRPSLRDDRAPGEDCPMIGAPFVSSS
jgi:hypothetical protein